MHKKYLFCILNIVSPTYCLLSKFFFFTKNIQLIIFIWQEASCLRACLMMRKISSPWVTLVDTQHQIACLGELIMQRALMYSCVSTCMQQGSPAGPSNRAGASAGIRPVSLSHSGATGPRPITQSELATALALASTPDSSAVTPTTASQVRFMYIFQKPGYIPADEYFYLSFFSVTVIFSLI